MFAGDVMSHQVITVAAGASLRQALAAMERAGLSKLPVFDGGRVVGLLTAAALRRSLQGGTGHPLAAPVTEAMDSEVTFVAPDLPLVEVLEQLRSAPALLVGEHQRLLGIITARDVARVAGPWLLVQEVEAALRRTINARLSQRSPRWYDDLLPDNIRRTWAHDRDRVEAGEDNLPPGQRHLAHATWWQYEELIESNWDAFSGIFRDRDEAMAHLRAVHEARNRLAHGLELSPEQLGALRAGARYLLKRIA